MTKHTTMTLLRKINAYDPKDFWKNHDPAQYTAYHIPADMITDFMQFRTDDEVRISDYITNDDDLEAIILAMSARVIRTIIDQLEIVPSKFLSSVADVVRLTLTTQHQFETDTSDFVPEAAKEPA